MEKITSISRVKETGASGLLAYRYYIHNGVLWFNLVDICNFFNHDSERFINKFYEETLDCNKIMFNDNNVSSGYYKETRFINKTAIIYLEEEQRIRHASLNVDIEDLEKEEGLTTENDYSNYEFKELVQNIKTELYTADRTKLNNYINKLMQTRQINEMVEERELDCGIEEEVSEYRNWLYEPYDPDKSIYMMYKSVHDDSKNCYYEKYNGPTIDEALDILFNAGREEI